MEHKITTHTKMIWHILDQKVIMSVLDLKLYINITEKELYIAVGWLTCEGKIHLLTDGNDNWKIVLLN